MCFSATASFALAGVLVPAGLATVRRAAQQAPGWTAFAAFPLAFGIQQIAEGFLWLGLTGGNDVLVATSARAFLFFSHLFWLVWVPYASQRIEPDPRRKRVIVALTALGLLFGLTIFMPAILIPNWLSIEIIGHSIEYNTTLIYEGFVTRNALRLVYAAIILGALLLSSHAAIRLFGLLIAVSLVLTYIFYAYAFISVWCFFAAILSVYLAVVIARQPARLQDRTA